VFLKWNRFLTRKICLYFSIVGSLVGHHLQFSDFGLYEIIFYECVVITVSMTQELGLLVTVTGWYRTKRSKHCSHFWYIVLPDLSSDTPDSSASALWLHQRHLAVKQGVGEKVFEFSWRNITVILRKVLLHAAKSFNMGSSALLPIRREMCCGFWSPLKIHRLGRVLTRVPWVGGKHTTEGTALELIIVGLSRRLLE
jgi:hypothetical protein